MKGRTPQVPKEERGHELRAEATYYKVCLPGKEWGVGTFQVHRLLKVKVRS